MNSRRIDCDNRPLHSLPRRASSAVLAATLVLPGISFAQTGLASDAWSQASHASHATHQAPKAKGKAEEEVAEKMKPASGNADAMEGMDHSQMEGMEHGPMDGMKMQGGSAPPDARDPDYSDGVSHGSMAGMESMHGESSFGRVLFDRLEQFHGESTNGQAIDLEAWYGSDLSKLRFKLDGERSDGHLGASRSELLWDRALSAYWDVQVGARHDFGEGPTRDWAAFGFHGLAPYWFDVEATVYVGESGRTALRLEAEYELLLTQRLILQPDVEVNFHGKNDPAREIGSGLSDIDFGLRLRYEFTRKFAPYIGLVWSRKFGTTATYAREADGGADDTRLVAGVRLWF